MLYVKYTQEGYTPLEHTVMPLQRSYLFSDEGAWKSDSWPKEDATAENDLSVETVPKVAKDRGCNHETADENCKGGKKRLINIRPRTGKLIFCKPIPLESSSI